MYIKFLTVLSFFNHDLLFNMLINVSIQNLYFKMLYLRHTCIPCPKICYCAVVVSSYFDHSHDVGFLVEWSKICLLKKLHL